VLFERFREPRWRACGVYASPRTRARLSALGLDDSRLGSLIRPISAMNVESTRGALCRLDYSAHGGACGIDRVRLDRALLEGAAAAGALVREGAVVRSLVPSATAPHATELSVSTDSGPETWTAGLVVGADGPGSMVARAFGVLRASRHFRRAGLTVHHPDPAAPEPAAAMEARMVIGRGWYCGLAPVPGRRVNIGVVVAEGRLRAAVADGRGPDSVVQDVLASIPGPREPWRDAPPSDGVAVALPLAHRVTRRAGRGFLLVGDAAGFIDPLSGEGLHRALVSAELGAEAAGVWLRGSRQPTTAATALEAYDRRMSARFRGKDVLSWLLQVFVEQPRLLDHALDRLARRPVARRTFARVMADLVPASRALEPGFLAAVIAP
ncbi:MAG TPA: FAD-dependent monooxygenase, partial [Thermoleophilaceae bacterium]